MKKQFLCRNTEACKYPLVGYMSMRVRVAVLKVVIVILLLVLCVEFVFYLFVVPATSFAKVEFSGNVTISPEYLMKAAGLTGKEKWMSLDGFTISERLASVPLLAQVEVLKKFPDTMHVHVVERVAIALGFVHVQGRAMPVQIDKTGTVFSVGTAPLDTVLPVVSGLEFRNPRVGLRVHDQLVPLFVQLDNLSKRNPLLLGEISEISIEQKRHGGYDLALYLVRAPIRVRMDKNLSEEKLRYVILIVDALREWQTQRRIKELDVRGGTAVYR